MREFNYREEYRDEVLTVRDCLKGQRAIKKQTTLYLPRPDGMTASQYANYLERASYLGIAERALSGLTGIALRRDPIVALPPRMESMRDLATVEGNSLDMLTEWVLRETLSIGYSCLLLDFPHEGTTSQTVPYVASYTAESVIEYKVAVRDGRRKLIYLKLQEDSSAGEPERQLVLRADPYYEVQYLERDGTGFVEYEAFTPSINGRPIDYIPAVFPSPANLDPGPEKPPFADLCDLSISHFRNSADLEHILYLCASPTPYTTGALNEKQKPTSIGAGAIWHLGADGSAGYLEPKGGGIQHLREVMGEKKEEMGAIAARFIFDGMNRNEAPETARLRTSGELSLLRGSIRSTEAAIRQLLNWAAEWTSSDPDAVRFEMEKDLGLNTIDAKLLDTISKAVMAGQISKHTFIEALQRADVVSRDRSIEDELELIEIVGE